MASSPSYIDNNERETSSFFCFIFQVLILWSTIGYLIWICLIPKTPHYTITSVHLLLPNHTNYSTTSNASLILQLEVSNPNKGISIYSASGNVSYWISGVSDHMKLENATEKDFPCNIYHDNMFGNVSYWFPGVSDTKHENATKEMFPCNISNVSGNLSCWFPGVSSTKLENATEKEFPCNILRNISYWFPGVSDPKCENTSSGEEFSCNVGNKPMRGFCEGYKGNFTLGLDVNLGKVFWCWGKSIIDGGNNKDMKIRISLKTWVRFKYRIFKTVTKKHLIEMEAYVPVALDGRKVENLRIKPHNIEKKKS